MPHAIRIGLVGDHDASIAAHAAIPRALAMSAATLRRGLAITWLSTDRITEATDWSQFDGLWCVPGSPYRSLEGALRAIRYARVSGTPFLGTCGGFQHAILEYARNALGWQTAEHGESSPEAALAVISPLSCALVEVSADVHALAGTRIADAYRGTLLHERYHCRFGLNPAHQARLLSGPLRAAALDAEGAVRAVELDGHPFFVATLFQPERAALRGHRVRLVDAFLQACTAVVDASSPHVSLA